jgi:ankyrin repeat protein
MYAAKHGHLDIIKYIFDDNHEDLIDWSSTSTASTVFQNKQQSLQQCFITAIIYKQIALIDYLIETFVLGNELSGDLHINIECVDSAKGGETALTLACANGCLETCELLVIKGRASLETRNTRHLSPFICAIKANSVRIVNFLLGLSPLLVRQLDKHGRNGLQIASSEGFLGGFLLLLYSSDLDNDHHSKTPRATV